MPEYAIAARRVCWPDPPTGHRDIHGGLAWSCYAGLDLAEHVRTPGTAADRGDQRKSDPLGSTTEAVALGALQFALEFGHRVEHSPLHKPDSVSESACKPLIFQGGSAVLAPLPPEPRISLIQCVKPPANTAGWLDFASVSHSLHCRPVRDFAACSASPLPERGSP